MGDGALGSDHINYLILRYLQEAGHENAAKALHQDWHRPDQYKDPEDLPFASKVKQSELVNIIQDGLYYDQTQAHVTNQLPRHRIVDPLSAGPIRSEPTSIDPNAPTRNTQQQQQPSQTSHTRRSSHVQQTNDHDFPLPAPKRARKSNGDSTQIVNKNNGDTTQATPINATDPMDLDSKTPLTTADDARSDQGIPTDTDRAMSEAADQQQSVESPPFTSIIETSSEGTQTDKKLKAIKPDTQYWSVDKHHAQIVHALWNPQPGMPSNLLVAGDALCRFYQVDSASASANPAVNGHANQHTPYFDVEDMPAGSITTAACWHPDGRHVTCAVELPHLDTSDEITRCLFDVDSQKPHSVALMYRENAYLRVLQQQNRVVNMALRYNTEGSLLLSVSTSLDRGIVDIWHGPNSEPVAMKVFDGQIMDAVWAGDDEIIVCGDQCLEAYKVGKPKPNDSLMTNGNSNHLTSQHMKLLYSHPTDKMWGKVRYDAHNRVVAVIGIGEDEEDDGAILILSRDASDAVWTPLPGYPSHDGSRKHISAMAFEPPSHHRDILPRRLATTHHTGDINIYAVTALSCSPLQTLRLGNPHSAEPALALSWSPDGKYIAAASEDAIQVWNPAVSKLPILSWRASHEHWATTDDSVSDIDEMEMGEDVEVVHEPCLAWDAKGTSLLFAAGKRMATIRLLRSS